MGCWRRCCCRKKDNECPLLGRWAYYSGYSDSDGLLVLLSDFVALTVRDHCDPFKVYKAMAEIDEFISHMAIDV